ncbi:MAG TPA: hypothetical protein VKD66_14695, partial [Streptosporangiaceae bacterium]|nr:hypothetical protein [Streptosporangiaceae bacterium]
TLVFSLATPAGDREPGSNRIRCLVGPVSKAIRLHEFGRTAAVHGDDTSEFALLNNRANRL